MAQGTSDCCRPIGGQRTDRQSSVLYLCAVLIVWFSFGTVESCYAMDGAKSASVVAEAFDEMTTTFGGKKLDAVVTRQSVASIIRRYANLRMTAEYMLGRYWEAAPSDVKDRFIALMGLFLVTSFAKTAADIPADLHISILRVDNRGSMQVVHSKIGARDGDQSDVNWDVAEADDGRYVINDVSMDGVLVITAMMSDWMSVIRQYGGALEGLLGPLELMTRSTASSESGPLDNRRHQR